MFMKRLTLALLALALLFSCAACGENGDPSATTPGQPEEAQTYTAVLVDNRTGTPATAYYGYEGDTTPAAILTALAAQLGVEFDLLSAEVTPSEARVVFGSASALAESESEEALRGLLDSVYLTSRQNYGRDKALFVTVGDGAGQFGIDLSGQTAYQPDEPTLPEPEEGELSAEDAKVYAINLTYGILGEATIELEAQLNDVIVIGDEHYYDVSVSSAADPGSIMRRFAISFDGLSAYLYNAENDMFERY